MLHAARARVVIALAIVLIALPSAALTATEESVDLDAIYRIKQEGLRNSQVMETMSWLTDVYGPRLTGSPNIRNAGEWAVEMFKEWGLVNVQLETWGEFGRGWSNQRCSLHVIEPQMYPLIGFPKAWTPGTDGKVVAEAIIVDIDDEADFEQYRGKLAGKITLTRPLPDPEPKWDAPAHRLTDEELAQRAMAPEPGGGRRNFDFSRFRARRDLRNKIAGFLREEGVVATLEASNRDTGGTVFVSGGGSREIDADPTLPQIVLTAEHYGRIYRTLQKEIPVKLELDIQNTFHDEDTTAFNVVAELPGTDLADELVILGAHFDSWHSGTGATDNGAGSAAMMEAVRIIAQAGLHPRRTLRVVLWSGEEQGLLGSRAYVKEHFADPGTMDLKPEHAKVAAYFNLDNGTGAIRGVYLQGNEAVAPIFEQWMKPFHNLGMTTLTIRNTGGTDHLAFDAVGLPGFQFIQDPIEYNSRTHHSNMDTYERIQAGDMIKNATIIAAFAYHAAMRDEGLPRKPLPKPRPNAFPR